MKNKKCYICSVPLTDFYIKLKDLNKTYYCCSIMCFSKVKRFSINFSKKEVRKGLIEIKKILVERAFKTDEYSELEHKILNFLGENNLSATMEELSEVFEMDQKIIIQILGKLYCLNLIRLNEDMTYQRI